MTTPDLKEAQHDLELTERDCATLFRIVAHLTNFIADCGQEDRSGFKTDLFKYRGLLLQSTGIKKRIERHIETLKQPTA